MSWMALVATGLLLVVLVGGIVWYTLWKFGKALDEDSSRPSVRYLDDED